MTEIIKRSGVKTRVVNVRRAPCDVYIGRNYGGWQDAGFGNPFKLRPGVSRKLVIAKYTDWILASEQKALRERARRELKGKRMGCWCAPLACHGDILAKIAEFGELLPAGPIPYEVDIPVHKELPNENDQCESDTAVSAEASRRDCD